MSHNPLRVFVLKSLVCLRVAGREIPKGVEVYAVNGPFFFGAADKLGEVMTEIAKPPKVFILRMAHVPAIDATGIHALEQLAKKCKAQGTKLILSEVRAQPLAALAKAEKLDLFDGLADTLDEALGPAAAPPSTHADQREEGK